MTQPQQPPDPPTQAPPSDHNPSGTTPNGVPEGMDEHEAKGSPKSDRNDTEKSAG